MQDLAGSKARIVRSILFDKSAGSNWLVPWHQDATIAVRERRDAPGFGPWSIKEGVPHCRPPRDVLESLVVIRVALDACGPANGPLQMVPGSHKDGLLTPAALSARVAEGPVIECCTGAGGVVLMRSHTVHSSAKAIVPSRRRVLHLEVTPMVLPAGLQWAEDIQGLG